MRLLNNISTQQLSLLFFSVVKVVTGFTLYKWVSLTYGIESLAILGQAISLGALVTFLATGGISRGIIHYLSKHQGDELKTLCLRQSARRILFISSIFCSCLLYLFASQLSQYMVGGDQLVIYIYVLAICTVILGFNNLSLAYCAVEEKQVWAMSATAAGMVTALLGTMMLGAVLEAPIYLYYPVAQAVLVFVFLVLVVRKTIFPYFRAPIRKNLKCSGELTGLLRHSGVLILSVCISAFVAIYMRREIIDSLGLGEAGIWEVSQKISDGYMQFFGLFLVYYLLQKMSADDENKIKYLLETIRFFLVLLILLFAVMFYMGEAVISLLFSSAWAERANQLVLLILIGDLFRIVFITMQYYYLSQDKVWLFVVLELTWGSTLLILFNVYPDGKNTADYGVAYILAFSICLLVSVFAFKMLKSDEQKMITILGE